MKQRAQQKERCMMAKKSLSRQVNIWQLWPQYMWLGRRLMALLVGVALVSAMAMSEPVAAAALGQGDVPEASKAPPAAAHALYMPMIDGGKVAASMSAGNAHTCALLEGRLSC